MATLEDMIQEVLLNMEGFTGDQDMYAVLANDITAEAGEGITLDGAAFPDGSGFTTGIVEIGDELVNVLRITTGGDIPDGSATLYPVLRGWRGTTAKEWPAGTLARNNPRFPRQAVIRAINDTIRSMHPRISAIKTYEFVAQGARVRYDVPQDVRNVLQVQWFPPGASRMWIASKRWGFDLTGGSTSVTGRALDVWDAMPGRKVQVVYQAEAQGMTELTDDFEATTGLFDWVRDIVIYGACYRLASFLDAQKATITTAEQAMMNSRSVYGNASFQAGQSISKHFQALYQSRMAEAENRLQDMYPVARHYIS